MLTGCMPGCTDRQPENTMPLQHLSLPAANRKHSLERYYKHTRSNIYQSDKKALAVALILQPGRHVT